MRGSLGRHAGATPGHPVARLHVVLAVAVDDPERAAGAVGDVEALLRRPPRQADALGTVQLPADAARIGVDRGERAAARGRDVEPARRPRRVLPGAEPLALAAALDDPHAAVLADEQPPGRGQFEAADGGGGRRRLLDHGAHPVADLVRQAAVALGHADRDGGRKRGDPHQPDGARAPPRRGLRVRGDDGLPRALARRHLLRQRRLAQGALECLDLVPGHRSSSSASASASSARRSLELTVPRGRSSIAAISPGV